MDPLLLYWILINVWAFQSSQICAYIN